MHGKGLFRWCNNNTYEGMFINGKMEGEGVYLWSDGRKFEGNYKNGVRWGRGRYINYDGQGSWCDGIWRKSKLLTGRCYDAQGKFLGEQINYSAERRKDKEVIDSCRKKKKAVINPEKENC